MVRQVDKIDWCEDYENNHGVTPEGRCMILYIESATDMDLQGMLDNCYLDKPIPFNHIMEMIFMADSILDQFEYPKATVNYRSNKRTKQTIVPLDERLAYQKRVYNRIQPMKSKLQHLDKRKHFVVNILFRQNASWQGELVVLEKRKVISKTKFRSIYELLRLIYEEFDINIGVKLHHTKGGIEIGRSIV